MYENELVKYFLTEVFTITLNIMHFNILLINPWNYANCIRLQIMRKNKIVLDVLLLRCIFLSLNFYMFVGTFVWSSWIAREM